MAEKQKLGSAGWAGSALLVLACSFMLLQFVSLYFSWQRQALVGVVMVLVCGVLAKAGRGKRITVALMLLSLAATLRYSWWRIRMVVDYFTDQSNARLSLSSFFMVILVAAEAYTLSIMVLGYMQTSQVLQRKPVPMPADEDLWPHVDVLIPTYNEPLPLVRYTALAAINMDYPPEKLHVWILDDGTRAEFREFAEQAGVGYVVRAKHDHAKAGNINHALKQMTAPLVTIFDCDHVPTRSFLQCTVGWFLVEDRLAMLQTPHYFYSPDPFERNLQQHDAVPNEGELFYGMLQDGNDFWNATFFCGSCAVIRRKALEEVGGIATETVTEDAHTSLRMQKRGWNTAYINVPQAAGLATETLAAHVGQRVRWARGMIQIMRTDCPLLARGMKLTQRLCYFNAMLHFLYALPRLIFLVSPLAYMLGGFTIIPGYWLAILAYAMPHLILSSATNSRIQGRHRHSFWNEIYETVLAPYILLPTLLALVNPKLGKFNVTDKGTTLEETMFDRKIAKPTTWLLLLNLAGVLITPYRIYMDPTHMGVILSNVVWIVFNMVILGVAAAVAHEQKQRRSSVRVPARLPVAITRADGTVLNAETRDMSVGGASAEIEGLDGAFSDGEVVKVRFPLQTGEDAITARTVGARGQNLRLQFLYQSMAEEETLTRALYSRADSWINARDHAGEDRPMLSLLRVVRLSFTGFHQVALGLVPRKKAKGKLAAAVATAALILAALFAAKAHGQQAPPTVPASAAQPSSATVALSAPTRETRIQFKDLGVFGTADLRGSHSYYVVHFVLPHTELPRTASLLLSYHFAEQLRTGRIRLRLNDTPVADVNATHGQEDGAFAVERIALPPELLIRQNDLSFEFDGQARAGAGEAVLAQIGASSRIEVEGDPVPFRNDLALLPLPLFDGDVPTTSTITFAFPHDPDANTLRAAGVVASWFGILSSARPVRFAVVVGSVPAGNAVVLATGADRLPYPLTVPQGASLQIVANPADANGSLLIVGGTTGADLLAAARALSLRKGGHITEGVAPMLEGTLAQLPSLALPAAREPDDAPRWLPVNKLVSLASYSPQPEMQGDGSRPLPVYFRVAPDTYYGEAQNLPLHLHYRYNSGTVAEGSALRTVLNGELVNEAPLAPGAGNADGRREALLPVAKMRPFGNTLSFQFDFVPAQRPGYARQAKLIGLQGSILRDSALDLREAKHYATLPNLELFGNAGFPFTRMADLEQTAVVLPIHPTGAEIALFLQMMGHCGRETGYPALRVEVVAPEEMTRGDRDYLVLGTLANQPAFATLAEVLPVVVDANGVTLRRQQPDHAGLRGLLEGFPQIWHDLQRRFRELLGLPQPGNELAGNVSGTPAAVLQGVESPYGAGRSLVTVALRDDAAEEAFTDAFLDLAQSSEIASSVSLLDGGHFRSYVTDTGMYHLGTISWYMIMRIWLTENFWVLMLGVLVASLVLASGVVGFLHRQMVRRLSYPKLPDGTPEYRRL